MLQNDHQGITIIMLRQFSFKNLGLFNENHSFKEANQKNGGLFAILIGENGSGKSSIFEFIRRCLSSEITKSESNKADPNEAAFAKCDFDFEEKEWVEIQSLIPLSEQIIVKSELKQNEDEKVHKEEIADLTLYKYVKDVVEKPMKKYVSVGIIYAQGHNHVKYKFFNLIFKGDAQTSILLLERNLHPDVIDFMVARGEVTEFFENQDKGEKQMKPLNELIVKLDKLFYSHLTSATSSQERHIEGFIKAIYAKLFGKKGRTSFLFAHRGIGPLDSSLSDKMSMGKQNYEDTVSKAELMAVKLQNLEKQKVALGKDAETWYKRVAYEILGNNCYEFKAVGRNKVIMINKDNNNAEVELLKAPEGVYEAHVIALLLTEISKDKYFTLCLDEPNKCMHPAQVERLREILLRKIKDGRCSIVCSTHSRDMISFDTWKHVHYFRRLETGNLTLKHMFHSSPKLMNFFTRGSESFKDILFARKCLFVKNAGDYRFFKLLLKEWRDTSVKDLTVVECSGDDHFNQINEFCKTNRIPHVIWQYKSDNKRHFYGWGDGLTTKAVVQQYPSVYLQKDTISDDFLKEMTLEVLRSLVKDIIIQVNGNTADQDHTQKCMQVLSNKNNFVVNIN